MIAHVILLAISATTASTATAEPVAKPAAAEAVKDVLPFIENDYPGALARARERKVPLFIDAWAPWCHTCRSMRAFVLTDKLLAPQADRYVWLSLDAEDAKNASIRKQLGISALPTFFVMDPADEHVAIRWVGGGTASQMSRLLDAGVLAVAGGEKGDPAAQALVRADRAYGVEKYDEAIPAYKEALAKAPEGWPGTPRAIESLLFAYSQTEKPEEGAKLAKESWPKLRGTTSGASAAAGGLDAALALPAENPDRPALVKLFEAACREVLADGSLGLAGDDRSGLYFSLESAREDAKDEAGLKKLREEHVAMLEKEAAAAKTSEQRAVFDPHRLSLYIDLETPEKAIPMLEQSQRDFPDDYNPPARLALAYKAMKKWPEALAASDRAKARVYGPRQLVVLQARADIYKGMGDVPTAKKTLEDAIAVAQGLPEGQRNEKTIASLQKKLDKIDKDDKPR